MIVIMHQFDPNLSQSIHLYLLIIYIILIILCYLKETKQNDMTDRDTCNCNYEPNDINLLCHWSNLIVC